MRRVRMEWGVPMRDMADLLGVNVSTISRIESGGRRVRTAADARMLAGLLGVRVGYLVRACPHCGYEPPCGYQCLRCGTSGEPAPAGGAMGPPAWALAVTGALARGAGTPQAEPAAGDSEPTAEEGGSDRDRPTA
jgi:DNA-binding XRE family transcriptional regulator